LSLSRDPGGLYSWYLNFHTFAFWFFLCVEETLTFKDSQISIELGGQALFVNNRIYFFAPIFF
jgi:hypothetical protein